MSLEILGIRLHADYSGTTKLPHRRITISCCLLEKSLLWGREAFVHYLQLKQSFISQWRVPNGMIKIAERDFFFPALLPPPMWNEELLFLLFYTLHNFLCLEGFHVWFFSYIAFQNTLFRGDAFQKTSLFCSLALEERHMWKRFQIPCFLNEIT